MRIKVAHYMSKHVVAFTTAESKRDAGKVFGTNEVLVSCHTGEMEAYIISFHFILSIIAVSYLIDF